jgi:hypothetical protein
MTRTSITLGLAAAFALVVALAGQTASSTQSPTPSDRDSISVTGCLQKDASGAFTLVNAQNEASKTSSTAGAGTATGTTGAASTPGATWKLAGETADLDKHVGHKVSVTGKESNAPSSSTATSGVTGTARPPTTAGEEHKGSGSDHAKTLDVKSVTMISSSCS